MAQEIVKPMLLTVRNGMHEGWAIRLVNESYSLGRNRDNDLILVDRWISRRHCLFSFVRGAWHIVDLDSTHGVRVNAQMVDGQQRLEDGFVIELGEVRLDVNLRPVAPPLESLQVVGVQEHPAVLRIESGKQTGLEVRLDHHVYTVGRTRNNDIILADGTISRRHCLIGRTRNDWYILDLNSRHGVVVNGQLVDERQALHGDEAIQVGDVQMALRFVFDPLAAEGLHAQTVAPVPLVLAVQDGLHEGWEIPLVQPSYTIGRSRCNDLVLADPSISRIHCLFIYHRDHWTVEDLGSSLGVEVSGAVTEGKTVLRGGERLKLGDVTLLVKTAFSSAEDSTVAEPGRERKRARRKLRIIQTLPAENFEQTLAMTGGSEDVGLDTQERELSSDIMGRLEEAQPGGRRTRPRDEHEMMDTVNVELDGELGLNQALPLGNEDYIKTYSLELPPGADEETQPWGEVEQQAPDETQHYDR